MQYCTSTSRTSRAGNRSELLLRGLVGHELQDVAVDAVALASGRRAAAIYCLHVAQIVYRKAPISIHISRDLINNLFSYPYTKIEFVQHDLKVSRLTATRYLEALTTAGFLHKRKIGRSNYYINLPLYAILTGEALPA
jgi:hypothetical protein